MCFFDYGGERGIRTPGEVTPTSVFKTDAFDRSAISPDELSDKNKVCFYTETFLFAATIQGLRP